MKQKHPGVGLCFFGNQLFYAINDPGKPKKLARIGSFDFNFDLPETLINNSDQHFSGILQTIYQLREEYHIQHLRVFSFPSQECWTSVPKIVYDDADEREKHINILMNGTNRKQVQPTWYSLSNQDYKFLLLRNSGLMKGMHRLMSVASTADLVSDFEIGLRWIRHRSPGGSFMTVCCFSDCLSVCSYILGKLRGATYITYDEIQDLPYLWLQHSQQLNWMRGLHEETYVYGINAYNVIDILKPFWDEAGNITTMDSLDKIHISADEDTYGFNLEEAFPAIMLALDY